MANGDNLDGGVGIDASGSGLSNDPVDAGAIAGCLEDPPQVCPSDFVIEAPCRIIKARGGSVILSAEDPRGYSGGTFLWSTSSNKIRLSSSRGSSINVTGLNNVSRARDAETITVTRIGLGCAPITKTIQVTVAKVTFSKSNFQRYGFDNMDTPSIKTDDHICIKRSDYTFVHVKIEGGLIGTDFKFECETPLSCSPAAPSASNEFDLRLNAGSFNKINTTLNALSLCEGGHSFGSIRVHVYKECEISVVVAKVFSGTNNLRFPTADYSAHSSSANDKLREAVVKFNIENFKADNGCTKVSFVSSRGELIFDIASSDHGPDMVAINNEFLADASKTRVVVVKTLKSYYYLDAAVPAGQNWARIRNTANRDNLFLTPGNRYPIGNAGEFITIVSVNVITGTIIFSPPVSAGKNYPAGTTIEFNAGAWSGSPIVIQEGVDSLDVIKWTILHEVGHRMLRLADVNDRASCMHFMQSWTDYRLRWCGRALHYKPGEYQNQWDLIPRI
jgi:hypothetical protein